MTIVFTIVGRLFRQNDESGISKDSYIMKFRHIYRLNQDPDLWLQNRDFYKASRTSGLIVNRVFSAGISGSSDRKWKSLVKLTGQWFESSHRQVPQLQPFFFPEAPIKNERTVKNRAVNTINPMMMFSNKSCLELLHQASCLVNNRRYNVSQQRQSAELQQRPF